MLELFNIAHPFLTVEEFQRRAGQRLGRLIHRLAGKYPQLISRCGRERVLMALSVAWGLSGVAKAGNVEAFAHIDDALQPQDILGCVKPPSCGCVMVEGEPFVIGPEEQPMLRFLWDGFTIFIDHEGVGVIKQVFFDLADLRQSKAYAVMGECSSLEPPQSTDNLPDKKQPTDKPSELEEERQRQRINECLGKNISVPLSKKTNKNASEDTLREMMNFCIDYACDIDRVLDEARVDAIKDMLEGIIDSPLGDSLATEQMMVLAKRIRGIKRKRCELKKARMEEERKARCGSSVNNFFGPIGQQVFSAGTVSSSIAPSNLSPDKD